MYQLVYQTYFIGEHIDVVWQYNLQQQHLAIVYCARCQQLKMSTTFGAATVTLGILSGNVLQNIETALRYR